jgi:hypothetical protein
VGFRVALVRIEPRQNLLPNTFFVDESVNLSNVLATAPSNSRIVIGPGTYPVQAMVHDNFSQPMKGPLLIANKTNIVVEGSGWATIITATNDGNIFGLENVSNVTLRDFRIERERFPNAPFKPSFSLVFAGVNRNIVVDSVGIYGAPNHGMGGSSDTTVSDEVTIRNCRFENCGALVTPIGLDGAAIVVSGRDWLIDSCYFTNCLRGVEIYDGGGKNLSDCRIVDNTFDYVTWQSICITGGGPIPPHAGRVSGINIVGNTIKNVLLPADTQGELRYVGELCGIVLNFGWGHRVIGNRIYNIQGWVNATPRTNPGHGTGLILSSGSGNALMRDVIVANNDIRGCKYRGIWIQNKSITNLLVANNTVVSNGSDGIVVQSDHVRVVGNTVADNNQLNDGLGAISVVTSLGTGNYIADNVLYNSAGGDRQRVGIRVGPQASNNILLRNRIWNTPTPLNDEGVATVLEKIPSAGSAILDFPNVSSGSSEDLTIPVPGVEEGDTVDLKVPADVLAGSGNLMFTAWSSDGTVVVRCTNIGSGPSNPSSGLFKVLVR